MIEDDRHDRAQALADHRRPGRAGNAHLREAEQAEDEDRVEDDIRDRTNQLRDHGIDRAAGRLQKALKRDLAEHTERAQHADIEICDAVLDNGLNVRLCAHIGTNADQAGDEHEQIAQQRQQQAVDRDLIDALGVFLPQRARQQRVDADTEADLIVRTARTADKAMIAAVDLFDVYQGKGIDPRKKSVAIAVTLQPQDKTLTDQDIDGISKKIVDAVTSKTGGVLRG